MLILGYEESAAQAKRLAQRLNARFENVKVHRFPDGESKVTLPETLPSQIVLYRSLDRPNDKLIELLLTCETARAQGVKEITLVAPYLCYMRQDIAFHPGEAVSQKIVGHWLGSMVDTLVTVEPHLHRIDTLDEVIIDTRAVSLSTVAPMAEFLKKRPTHPILVGPDEESRQWVEQLAEQAGLDWGLASKTRHGDFNVVVNMPEMDFSGRQAILVDDVISTGRTVNQAAIQLKQMGAQSVHCLVTHALFSADAETILEQGNINSIWSTDSINHHTNTIALTELLATALE